MRVLVIEDNPKLAAAIQRGLREHGLSVDVSYSGYEGEEMAASEPYDVVVLDLMLPDVDGLDVCRNLRRRGVTVPILMLTVLSETWQKVAGLDAGADDYLTKPFDFEEFVARVRALLRRHEATESTRLCYRGLELDLVRRTLQRGDQSIKLSAKEFALLEYLMRNPERVLTRTSILEKVWDMNYEPASNVVDVYISSLRRKIDRGLGERMIHTVIGAGYRFGVDEPELVTPR